MIAVSLGVKDALQRIGFFGCAARLPRGNNATSPPPFTRGFLEKLSGNELNSFPLLSPVTCKPPAFFEPRTAPFAPCPLEPRAPARCLKRGLQVGPPINAEGVARLGLGLSATAAPPRPRQGQLPGRASRAEGLAQPRVPAPGNSVGCWSV